MSNGTFRRLPARALAVGGLACLQVSPLAATFTYVNCDLVAAFRLPNGPSDLVVNLGPVAPFLNAPPKTVLPITNVSAAQLRTTFSSLNEIAWSVSGAMRGNANYSQYPLQTLWVTAPRPENGTSAPGWLRKGQFTQGTTAGQIDAVGAGAVIYGITQPAGADNTATAIVIPSTDSYSYTAAITANGDFAGTFQGRVESVTGTNFDSGTTSSRSVLFELRPASSTELNAPGKVIGFFDFTPDGRLLFTAGPPPEPAVIASVASARGVATISFSTASSLSYRLRSTDAASLSLPVSGWSIVGNPMAGDGTILSIQETSVAEARFYSVETF